MIHELFGKLHDENLLKGCEHTVSEIRRANIEVFAVNNFDQSQKMLLGVGCDTSVATRTTQRDSVIVINCRAVRHAADMSGLDYPQALEGVLLHEWGHLFLLEHGGQADSESSAWDFAAVRSRLTDDQMSRLRTFCQHGMTPLTKVEQVVDSCAEWVRRFDELSAKIGYSMAWQATEHYRVILNPDALFSDLRRAGWSFDSSWAIAHEGDVDAGLQRLALDRMDKTELLRGAIPLEQLNPDGSLPTGASVRV